MQHGVARRRRKTAALIRRPSRPHSAKRMSDDRSAPHARPRAAASPRGGLARSPPAAGSAAAASAEVGARALGCRRLSPGSRRRRSRGRRRSPKGQAGPVPAAPRTAPAFAAMRGGGGGSLPDASACAEGIEHAGWADLSAVWALGWRKARVQRAARARVDATASDDLTARRVTAVVKDRSQKTAGRLAWGWSHVEGRGFRPRPMMMLHVPLIPKIAADAAAEKDARAANAMTVPER